jgi:MFS family permease
MIVSMLGASLAYNIDHETRRLVVVVFFMFLFVFFYSWGQGPVPFAYSSEVFPLLNREAGMSFAVFANLFGAGIFLSPPCLTFTLKLANRSRRPLRPTTNTPPRMLSNSPKRSVHRQVPPPWHLHGAQHTRASHDILPRPRNRRRHARI